MFFNDQISFIGECIQSIGFSDALFVSLFSAGLISGFTHCAFMCGPFVLSQNNNLKRASGALLLPYHMGRITTYVILTILFSSVMNLAFLFLPIRGLVIAPLLMLAGIIFIVNAFPMLRRVFPWVFNIGMPRHISKYLSAIGQKSNMQTNQYLHGMLLGLMPCGMIVGAIMGASSAPTIIESVLAMMAFGIGTMPALIMVAYGGQSLQNKFPRSMARIRQGAMIWSGLWLFIIAGTLVF